MTLSTDLDTQVTRYDETLGRDTSLLRDLISRSVTWIENEIGWHLGTVSLLTLYRTGGTRSIWLPQPPTAVTEVAIRYGSGWTVYDSDSYELRGDEPWGARELVLTDGSLWPGTRFHMSFLRTPGLGSQWSSFSTSSSGGPRNVRIKMTAGYDTADEWPQDLLGLLCRSVASEARTRPLARTRRSPDEETDTFRNAMSPSDWRILKYYRRMGREEAA